MNSRTLGIALGLVVLGIVFTGGAAAAQDSAGTPATVDAVAAGHGPTTVDDPVATPVNSLKTTPFSGCCCCEWRFKPSLDRLSDLRTEAQTADSSVSLDAAAEGHGPITMDDPVATPVNSLKTTPFLGCCCCEWRYKPSLDRLSDLRTEVQ